jgi:hypothetical protein
MPRQRHCCCQFGARESTTQLNLLHNGNSALTIDSRYVEFLLCFPLGKV